MRNNKFAITSQERCNKTNRQKKCFLKPSKKVEILKQHYLLSKKMFFGILWTVLVHNLIPPIKTLKKFAGELKVVKSRQLNRGKHVFQTNFPTTARGRLLQIGVRYRAATTVGHF